ncbi:hypothetical protein A4G19_05680 [Pasteurellaceae bacterium Macca]|nr:hypothetical protein [Pasteurellaceae bacterium Macca]
MSEPDNEYLILRGKLGYYVESIKNNLKEIGGRGKNINDLLKSVKVHLDRETVHKIRNCIQLRNKVEHDLYTPRAYEIEKFFAEYEDITQKFPMYIVQYEKLKTKLEKQARLEKFVLASLLVVPTTTLFLFDHWILALISFGIVSAIIYDKYCR